MLGIAASADFALQRGVYSDALAELALNGDPVMSDVGPLFELAMNELGERIPEQLEAAWILTRVCVQHIVQSTSSPVGVLEFLWWEVEHHECVPRGKVVGDALDMSQLMGICDSYSCPNENYYEPEQRVISNEDERRELLDHLARKEAKAWLERHPV